MCRRRAERFVEHRRGAAAQSDTGAASQQALGVSGELAQQSELLRRPLDEFLADVKAA